MGEITWRGVTIAWAHPSEQATFFEADVARMGAAQLERYRRAPAHRAQSFLAGRALIRDLVVRLGGGSIVSIDSVCARCGEDHVAPRTPGFLLSVSHAQDLVVVAAAPTAAVGALGVDVEAWSDQSRATELAPLFAPAESPGLDGWTRIEAAVKADGRGIRIDPGDVQLRAEEKATGVPEWFARLPGRERMLRVATLPGPPGFVLSAARD